MSAPKGNQFWKARSRSGREKIFKDPASLRRAAYKYFEWIEDNPLKETKASQFQGVFVYGEVKLMRAMTITGIARFLHINFATWQDYKSQEDFSDIINEIESIIFDQKFSGAAAGLLNASIIARELGLADKQENKQLDENGDVINPGATIIIQPEYVKPEPMEE